MMIKDVFKNLNTQEDLDWLDAFKVKHPNLGPTTKEFEQVYETTITNKRWMDKYLETVAKWLVQKTTDDLKVEDDEKEDFKGISLRY